MKQNLGETPSIDSQEFERRSFFLVRSNLNVKDGNLVWQDMARIMEDFQMKVNWGFMRNMEMINPSNSSSCYSGMGTFGSSGCSAFSSFEKLQSH